MQMMERYHERRLGHRIPLRAPVAARLRELFGEELVGPSVEARFQAHRAAAVASSRPPIGPTGLGTSAARLPAARPTG
ncbi:hypothetical protein [Kitasatospora sp. LaBMicrA B282]|uniref:hypothetical protein n=1 Tax=Kitasatospora sp. LaBMicrA B282 TaxID=3420949 RepID=UPI003D101EDE